MHLPAQRQLDSVDIDIADKLPRSLCNLEPLGFVCPNCGTPNRLAFVTGATVHFTLSLAQRAPSCDGKEANHAKSNVEGPSMRCSSSIFSTESFGNMLWLIVLCAYPIAEAIQVQEAMMGPGGASKLDGCWNGCGPAKALVERIIEAARDGHKLKVSAKTRSVVPHVLFARSHEFQETGNLLNLLNTPDNGDENQDAQ
ncbi:hypothetical protein M405DRAFT_840389 [Rhizopogon salebrosus TDB-379]|nr:hypothetical protein M405DRAFT_840389 [Rhizopogon salebrosus TDB-379]